MKIRPLSLDGAWEITPQKHQDGRGSFLEWYRFDRLEEVGAGPVGFRQGNLSVSAAGVVRGIHFAAVPPGQAKYVSCVRGRIWDAVVDLRVGSPTFGSVEGVQLDDVDRRAVYIAEGLGHGFCALSDNAVVAYLSSTTYDPAREHSVHPLDPRLAIAWPVEHPVLSPRDASAPSLDELRDAGLLPRHDACGPPAVGDKEEPASWVGRHCR
ncbi:dTDP-4-dehydrorhamnose 3,5-epimerase family protein [Micromonospora sp. NPDC051141]|uniref:dTDP-4-dehydrorhamnose 3,5-epimerase family protein n=1 Tax=Micromonospora sp. NPDC051141 TaxID=3364284 RepID=UPI0037933E68